MIVGSAFPAAYNLGDAAADPYILGDRQIMGDTSKGIDHRISLCLYLGHSQSISTKSRGQPYRVTNLDNLFHFLLTVLSSFSRASRNLFHDFDLIYSTFVRPSTVSSSLLLIEHALVKASWVH